MQSNVFILLRDREDLNMGDEYLANQKGVFEFLAKEARFDPKLIDYIKNIIPVPMAPEKFRKETDFNSIIDSDYEKCLRKLLTISCGIIFFSFLFFFLIKIFYNYSIYIYI